MPAKQPAVEYLISLLQANPPLKTALSSAIKEADEDGIKSLQDFYTFINGLLTHIPTDKQLNPDTEKFWYILNKAPDEKLKTSEIFNEWIREFILSMGAYMDTIESAQEIETFIKDSKNNIEDY